MFSLSLFLSVYPLTLPHVRIQPEGSHHKPTRKRVITGHQICWRFDLVLPAPRTGRNKCLLHKPLSPYFYCRSPQLTKASHLPRLVRMAIFNAIPAYHPVAHSHNPRTHLLQRNGGEPLLHYLITVSPLLPSATSRDSFSTLVMPCHHGQAARCPHSPPLLH